MIQFVQPNPLHAQEARHFFFYSDLHFDCRDLQTEVRKSIDEDTPDLIVAMIPGTRTSMSASLFVLEILRRVEQACGTNKQNERIAVLSVMEV
jgi:predicted MPP superfamily phosphohydrolase